jgi:hypothetical protein
MANYYYLTETRQPAGPISPEQLRDLHQQGVVRAETLVAKEGDSQWVPYSEVMASLAPPPPPAAASPALLAKPAGSDAPPAMPAAAIPAASAPSAAARGNVVATTPPRKKSRLWLWLSVGCLGLILLMVVGISVIFFFVMSAIKSSDPYRTALSRVQANPQAIQLLGEPIKSGLMVSGNISVQNDTGTVGLNFPVTGPKGAGTVTVQGEKQGGQWAYSRMDLEAGGQTVNLQDTAERAWTP